MGGKARSQIQKPRSARPSQARSAEIIALLHKSWGQATCELEHANPYQLLVATVASVQSSPRRVNQITPALFARYPDARALAGADPVELETLLRPTGFYRMKAENLIATARALVDRHDGRVPSTLSALVKLPGVTRKTANLVLGTAFGVSAGMAVDSHVQRVSWRLGLSAGERARDIERDLTALCERERWIDISHELSWHGRHICHAKDPACERCPLVSLCPSAQNPEPAP